MERDDSYLTRFYIYLNLFTSAMLGCVFADNLLVMFIFWELTGVTSFLLIGYFFTDTSSLLSARLVFLVTSLTSLFLLVGILIIGSLNNTFLWTEIVTRGVNYENHHFWQTACILCFMIAIFGKSAQIPFHFWLPNAMCAPTPISAYLHSATLVKLGVFLTARMYPLFVTSKIWFPLVVSVCLSTMLVGAILSLLSNDLKMILAYATVSQLGFFISIYGMGDVSGVTYDFVHILNHAFYKGSLFMLVGIISHATGIRDIRKLGGLFRDLPATSAIFFIATLAMAGVPGTTGFISKELIINDLLLIEKDKIAGIVILTLIASASIFKVAFSIRLFYHLFIRKKPQENIVVKKPQWQLLISPFILSLCALFFGIWPGRLGSLVESFYVSGLHAEELRYLKAWHGFSLELMISITIFALGILLFYFAEKRQVWSQSHPFPDFANLWNRLLERCITSVQQLTIRLEGSSVRPHLAILLLFFACTLGGILAAEQAIAFKGLTDFPKSIYRMGALIMIISTSLAIPFLSGGLSQVLALASSGFFITLYFVFYKAPDLAMTQILIEVVTGIMLLVMVYVLRKEVSIKDRLGQTIIRFTTALLFALTTMAICLSYTALEGAKPLAKYFLDSSIPLAKGANVVNTILVDFRGLDTLGEITVLLIAAIGIVGLLGPKQSREIYWDSHLVLAPSIILKTLSPLLFFMINFFAIYLLLRGHNQVGGGFIAGLASGIGFVLLGFSFQLSALKKLIPINLLLLSASGVVLALTIGLLPLLWGKAFLTHNAFFLPTALLFDIGVFIVVLAITLISIFALRSDALKEGKYYGNR
jgi:NADH:ubiquinone oxidoreductase subunit 5 (subunit L)/multisubunit Na+/H+ antiporter MnhA subunit/multisubunit Na+/H+ antiporter MnhB subunit